MKAVYFYDSDTDTDFAGDVLVTWVEKGEQESDALLRAMELCGLSNDYFVKEAGYYER